MFDYACVVTHYSVDFTCAVLEETFAVWVWYFWEQFEEESAEVDLWDQDFGDSFFLLAEICVSVGRLRMGWRIFGVLLTAGFLPDALISEAGVVFVGNCRFELNAVVDGLISEAVELVDGVLAWSLAVLGVVPIDEHAVLYVFLCFGGEEGHVLGDVDWAEFDV